MGGVRRTSTFLHKNTFVAVALTSCFVVVSGMLPSSSAQAIVIDQRNTTFSSAATAALPSGHPVTSISATPDGKWIAATDGGLVRLNADGTRDSSYLGNHNSIAGDINNRFVTAMDVDAQGGAILSSGFWPGGIGRRMPDGSIDSDFAVELTNSSPSLSRAPQFIKVLPNGDILLAGRFDGTNAFGGAALLKITATGENISSFNTNVGNYLTGALANDPAPEVYDLEVDSQGRILMAIQPYTAGLGALVRFNADGTPDTAFNQGVFTWLGDATNSSNATGRDVEILEGGGYLLTAGFGGTLAPKVNILPLNHSWVNDCWDITLFQIRDSGASDTAYNGTYDSSGICGTRTVVGGTYPSEIGFRNLKQYTGESSDNEVTTGNFVGSALSVEVDTAGNTLVGGVFSTTDGSTTSGLIRLSTTGSLISLAEEGAANWPSWGSMSRSILKSLIPSGDTLAVYSKYNGAVIRRYSGNVPVPSLSPLTQTVSGTAGTAISSTTILTPTYFTGAISYAVTTGTLPTGLALNTSNGVVTGTPTAASAATVSITATGAGSGSATASITFTIAAAPIVITTTTTTTAPSATSSVATTTTTTVPVRTSQSGPTLVTSANQSALTATPGGASALINGVVVIPQVVSASDSAAAQTDPAERTQAQVRELQQAASAIETRLDAVTGGDSGVNVVRTSTGAAMTGIFSGTPVPVEDVVVVNAADTATLFAARDVRGNIVEVKPGALLEVSTNGDVAVQAYGLRPGENVELVVMSTPTLLGNYIVDTNGSIKTTSKLPTTIGRGNHTLVVASKSVKASLGLKLVKSTATLPATGMATNHLTHWATAILLSGLYLLMVGRSRRRVI